MPVTQVKTGSSPREHVEVGRLPGVDRAAEARSARRGRPPGRGCAGRRRRACARRTAPRRPARGGSCGSARRSCRAPGRRASRREPPGRPARAAGRGGRAPTAAWRWRRVRRPPGLVAAGPARPSRAGRRPRTRSSPACRRGLAIISGLESSPATSRVRPALGQQRGQVARPAAEVDDGPAAPRRRRGRAARRTAAALVGVGEVPLGVPGVASRRLRSIRFYLDVKISHPDRRSLDVKILDRPLGCAPCGTRSTSWSRRGRASAPTSTSAPVAVFSRIARLARHLDLARREAFTAHGIESWEFDVLAALRRAGSAVPALPRRAAARDAGDQRDDDQPRRPARRPRVRRALPGPERPARRARAADRRGQDAPSTAPSRRCSTPSGTCWPTCPTPDRDAAARAPCSTRLHGPAQLSASTRAARADLEPLTRAARRPRATPARARPSRRRAR